MTPTSEYEGLNEDDLMKLYHDGDAGALPEMTILITRRLAKSFNSKPYDRNLVEEIIQESWEKIQMGAKTFRFESKVYSWAYRIAHNTYLDLIRRESTRSHLNDALEPLEGRADNSPEFTENAIINITVRSALLKIPKDQAEAVSLVWVDGYTYEQAGQMLGVPAGTIKSRVSRARPVLAEILRELDPQARN